MVADGHSCVQSLPLSFYSSYVFISIQRQILIFYDYFSEVFDSWIVLVVLTLLTPNFGHEWYFG